jgi:hypothetical protein
MVLSLTDILNISIFVIFLGISVIPFYIAGKLGKTTLGLVSLVLGLFAVTHGFYHLFFAVNMADLSLVLFGPLSSGLLLVFALYMYKRGN